MLNGADGMGHLCDAFSRAYDVLCFDDAAGGNEVFRQLVLQDIADGQVFTQPWPCPTQPVTASSAVCRDGVPAHRARRLPPGSAS